MSDSIAELVKRKNELLDRIEYLKIESEYSFSRIEKQAARIEELTKQIQADETSQSLFERRAELCSSCSGKGTGLLCSACCEEMQAARIEELTENLDGWREESRRMTEDNARLCRDMESLRALSTQGQTEGEAG